MIIESNITNLERQYRNFIEMVNAYSKNTKVENICVHKTSKGNWAVYDESGKKICLVSKFILTDEVVAEYKIKVCEK